MKNDEGWMKDEWEMMKDEGCVMKDEGFKLLRGFASWQTDWRTNKRMDICECRVAFATENQITTHVLILSHKFSSCFDTGNLCKNYQVYILDVFWQISSCKSVFLPYLYFLDRVIIKRWCWPLIVHQLIRIEISCYRPLDCRNIACFLSNDG